MAGVAVVGRRDAAAGAEALEGRARVRLAGPLTAATAPQLRARVRDAMEHGEARLLVDLRGVSGLDAAGIDARRLLEAQAGGTLVLRVNEVVCRALKETGTITAFALDDDGPGM